jgi:hypothetical protein
MVKYGLKYHLALPWSEIQFALSAHWPSDTRPSPGSIGISGGGGAGGGGRPAGSAAAQRSLNSAAPGMSAAMSGQLA